LDLLRGRVLDEVAETYPDFAAQMRRELREIDPTLSPVS
jgi:glutaconate CoA-transferase subunit B